jgi:hypothetical protein
MRLVRYARGLLRWLARQALTVLVVGVAGVVGWLARKASGPPLVSELVAAGVSAEAARRPASMGTVDPAGRAWVVEAEAMAGPSGSLDALKRALAASEVRDFGRLARSMLTHPLPLFRREVLEAVLPAWGEAAPAEAARFLVEYEGDLQMILGGEGSLHGIAAGIGGKWVRQDPEAALRFLPRGAGVTGGPLAESIWQGLVAGAASGRLGVVERLKLAASIHGESSVKDLLDRWLPGREAITADDWRELAASAAVPNLRARYQSLALAASQRETRGEAGAADARTSIAKNSGAEVDGVQAPLRSAADQAAYLRSPESAAASAAVRNALLSQLLQSDTTLARAVLRDLGDADWVDPAALGDALRGLNEQDLREWLAAVPAAEKRQEVVREYVRNAGPVRTPADLSALVSRAASFGTDGQAAVVAALTERSRLVWEQIPDVFASLPAGRQAATRMEVVLGLGMRLPDIAADLWMDASPAELAQPGAAVVAEELASRLLAENPEVASAWIRQLPPGESRDRAAARMIEATAAQDPETCAEWAATLVDAAARERAAAALAPTQTSPR